MENLNFEDFKEIKFGDIYDVDNVMSTDDECWEEFYGAIDKDDKLIINCYGVNFMRPWNNELFKKFLKEHLNVFFKIYNDAKLCNSINLACDLMGLSHRAIPENLISENKVVDKKLLKEEQELDEIISLFVNNERDTMLVVSSYCDSIDSGPTLDIIAKAIKRYLDGQDIDKFSIDARSVHINNNLVDRIIDTMRDLNMGKTEVKFISDDKELNDSIEMKEVFRHVDLVKDDERLSVLSKLPKNYPCMLIRYKNNRAKDSFGRLGRGEVCSCRAAIIKDIDSEYVYIAEYNGNDFYTYEHVSMERDGNVNELKPTLTRIKLHDVGYDNIFLGERYHIARAIQEDASDSTQMYVPSEDGFSTSVSVTIPERMKMVFDSWEIEYDKEELEACIRRTNDKLNVGDKKIGD